MTEGAFHEQGANSRDLHKFPELKFLQRHYIGFVLAQMALLFALGATLNAFFPELDEKTWRVVSREDHEPDDSNAHRYSFIDYEAR